jgi:hypothetical protein
MKTTIRKTVLVIAAFAASMSAFAQGPALQTPQGTNSAVKLSDAELDNITAGSGALVAIVIFNPGNASIDNAGTGFHCVNCAPNPFDGGKARLILIQNPARIVSHCVASIGGMSFCP